MAGKKLQSLFSGFKVAKLTCFGLLGCLRKNFPESANWRGIVELELIKKKPAEGFKAPRKFPAIRKEEG